MSKKTLLISGTAIGTTVLAVAFPPVLFGLAGLAGVATAGAVTFPWTSQALARRKLVFTVPHQNTVEAVMAGGNEGRFLRFTNLPTGFKWKGEGSNWDRWEIEKDSDAEPTESDGSLIGSLMHNSGLQVVGWPGINSIYTYPFTYGKVVEEDGKRHVVRQEQKDSHFVYITEVPYGIIVDDAETKDGVPIRVEALIMVRITNPYRALFGIKSWLEAVESIVAEVIKDYIGQQTFDTELWGEQTSKHRSGKLADMVLRDCGEEPESTTIAKAVRDQYGVKISDVLLLNIDPADGKFRELAMKIVTAEREGQAKIITASAEAESIALVATAEAVAVQDMIDVASRSPQTLEVLRYLTAQKIGEKGNMVVTGGIGNLMEGTAAKIIQKGDGQ